METHKLVKEQTLPLPIEEVFAFFSDARNLAWLTPPRLHFRIQNRGPIAMGKGTLIDYSLRVRGVPVRWQSEITVWEPPYRFVDVQRRGPYRHWVHTHSFAPVEGGTTIRDEIVYAVPGPSFVERLLVRPDLDRIFGYRQQQMARWADAAVGMRAGTAATTKASEAVLR